MAPCRPPQVGAAYARPPARPDTALTALTPKFDVYYDEATNFASCSSPEVGRRTRSGGELMLRGCPALNISEPRPPRGGVGGVFVGHVRAFVVILISLP